MGSNKGKARTDAGWGEDGIGVADDLAYEVEAQGEKPGAPGKIVLVGAYTADVLGDELGQGLALKVSDSGNFALWDKERRTPMERFVLRCTDNPEAIRLATDPNTVFSFRDVQGRPSAGCRLSNILWRRAQGAPEPEKEARQ